MAGLKWKMKLLIILVWCLEEEGGSLIKALARMKAFNKILFCKKQDCFCTQTHYRNALMLVSTWHLQSVSITPGKRVILFWRTLLTLWKITSYIILSKTKKVNGPIRKNYFAFTLI